MKLASLKLNNFRQHRNSEICFQDGLSAIVGANGAGKTTIVEAIAFALYGVKAIRGKSAEIVTRGFDQEARYCVELVFEHDGATFLVEREADDASISFAGKAESLAEGSRETTQFISNTLRMNLDEFCATYLTEQKGLEFLGGKRGQAERERFIVRMMGYDRLEQMQELLRSDRRDLKAEVAGAEGGLVDRAVLEQRQKSEKEELLRLETQVREAASILKDNEQREHRAQRELELLEAKAKQYVPLKERSRELELLKRERVNRLTQISSSLNSDGVRGEETHAQLVEGLKEKREKLQELEAALDLLRSEISRRENTWRESLIPLKNQRAVFESQLKDIVNSKRNISKLKKAGRCPTCYQELGQGQEHVKQHLEGEEQRLKEQLEQLEAKVVQASKEPRELDDLRQHISVAQARKAGLHGEIDNLNTLLRQSEVTERSRREAQTIEAELKALDKEFEQIEKQLKELAFDEAGYKERKVAYAAAERLTEVARLQKIKIEGEEQTCRAMLHRTEEELLEHDIKSRKVAQSKQNLLCFEQADSILTEFRRYLNANLRPRLAELASEYLSELTDGRYTTVVLSADFSPCVLEDGEPKSVISGGEEDILNLCLRLALSQMLAERANQSFSLLILDEVFGSLDQDRRNNVIGLLERLRYRFDQIIVITHIEEVKDIVEHLIYVEYDEANREVRLAKLGEIEEKLAVNL